MNQMGRKKNRVKLDSEFRVAVWTPRGVVSLTNTRQTLRQTENCIWETKEKMENGLDAFRD